MALARMCAFRCVGLRSGSNRPVALRTALPVPDYKGGLAGQHAQEGLPKRMSEVQPAGIPRAMRVFALAAVCAGVAALAGAAFVLSYAGIHVVVLQAGVSQRLARGYPLILERQFLGGILYGGALPD